VNLRGQMGIAGALVVACTLGVIAPVLYRAESGIVAAQFDASLASTAQQTTAPEFGVELKQSVGKNGETALTPRLFGGALVQITSAPAVGAGAPRTNSAGSPPRSP